MSNPSDMMSMVKQGWFYTRWKELELESSLLWLQCGRGKRVWYIRFCMNIF